jgi:hypothetical protein
MCGALTMVRGLIDEWIKERGDGFPPIVLHLTDGGSTDGDPTVIAKDLVSRATTDGNVLLFNCHVSSKTTAKVQYPNDDLSLFDSRARTLFRLSSRLPETFVHTAASIGLQITPGARGFVFNGDPVSVVQFFELGTRAVNLR